MIYIGDINSIRDITEIYGKIKYMREKSRNKKEPHRCLFFLTLLSLIAHIDRAVIINLLNFSGLSFFNLSFSYVQLAMEINNIC